MAFVSRGRSLRQRKTGQNLDAIPGLRLYVNNSTERSRAFLHTL
jgi:hypothetical protein